MPGMRVWQVIYYQVLTTTAYTLTAVLVPAITIHDTKRNRMKPKRNRKRKQKTKTKLGINTYLYIVDRTHKVQRSKPGCSSPSRSQNPKIGTNTETPTESATET